MKNILRIAITLSLVFTLMLCSACKENKPSETKTEKQEKTSSVEDNDNLSDSDVPSNEPQLKRRKVLVKRLKEKNTSSDNDSSNYAKKVTYDISDFEKAGDDDDVLSEAINEISTKILSDTVKGRSVEYTLKLKNKKYTFNNTINIQGCHGLTIDGNGASLVWKAMTCAFSINNTNNFGLKNLSIDYDPLPYTQGTIQSINDKNFVIKVDEGYRSDLGFLSELIDVTYMNLHDPVTGAFLENTSVDYTVRNFKAENDNKISFTADAINTTGHIPSVGDVVSIYQRGSGAIGIKNCQGLIFTNVNLYSSCGFGINEQRGGGGTVLKNCKIVPGPKPNGAKRVRVLSTNADATHFQLVDKGPTLDGCTITHSADDGINVHNFFYRVSKVDGNTVYISPKYEDTLPKIGQTLNFYKSASFAQICTAKIESVSQTTDPLLADANKRYWADTEGGCASAALEYVIKVGGNISGVSAGDIVSCIETAGKGTTVKNCTFGYNRARGIVIKCSDALIENNTIIGTSKAAIMVLADMQWGEAGFGTNIKIKNNTVINCTCDLQARKGDNYTSGSIMVELQSKGGFKHCYEYRNIEISGNTVKNSGTYGIFVSNSTNVSILNNTVVNPFVGGINNICSWFDIAPKSGIFVGMTKGGTVSGNKVTSSNKNITMAVEVNSECSNVSASKNELS